MDIVATEMQKMAASTPICTLHWSTVHHFTLPS